MGTKLALTVTLLVMSNVFMTWAWYGHLKSPERPLWWAIGSSWLIALVEYCCHVPASRLSYGALSLTQLKIIQEALSLTIFGLFATFAFGERLAWNHLLAFLLILAATALVFLPTAPRV